MNKWLKVFLIGVIVILVIAFVGILIYTRAEAVDFAHNTIEEQQARWAEESETMKQSPADYGLPFEDVTVINASGMKLNGWYIPSQNGASVMLMHGLDEFPYHMLEEAEMLYRYGYGSLLVTVRDHNFSDGDTASFGCDDSEMEDLEAWHTYLLGKDDVDPELIGIFGQSMGGSLVLQYRSQNDDIKAVIAHSTFASVEDTMVTTIKWKTGLPEWAAKVISFSVMFWFEQEIDCNFSEVASVNKIGDISPRAIFVMHAENDTAVSPRSGELLYEAANEPKEFWFCEDTTHHDWDTVHPEEFERRIIDFYDRFLLGASIEH